MKKLMLILMIAVGVSSVAFGQEKTPDDSKVKQQPISNKADYSVSFNHLALSVKDVDRSAEFYKKVLNLEEITNKGKMDGIRWFSLGDGKELHLISLLKDDIKTNKAVHLALETSGFDSFIKKLESMKITYSDWAGTLNKVNNRADGIKQIFLQDPDGYWIEINNVASR
ncbi:MAG: VOC family protein [Pyrinomonadaceae bacterium]|nr:VOC family protein [Pyrinomonadaceae bacterium]